MAKPKIISKIEEKANIYSPSLTGVPTAPTANANTDNTQIATTEFVNDAIETKMGDVTNALNNI